MTITPEQLDEWKRLAGAAAKAAPGDWDTDTIDNDGGGSGHFDSYCVFIAGKPGEIGKGIVDTLNSDNISVEVDGDEDGIRAWDENGRRVVEYIAAFDPPATLALIAEVERLRAEAETIRDLVLSEAAKVANEKRDEYEEECTVEWQASNDQQSIIAGAKADACVAVAAAILTLTGEK